MANYFNTLSLREQLEQLGQCEFMDRSEFDGGVAALKGKKIVIIGCGAQGLNQGLNMRDSGLDVSYTLRDAAIAEKRQSFLNASENGFAVGNYQEMIPTADLLINLTPERVKREELNLKIDKPSSLPSCILETFFQRQPRYKSFLVKYCIILRKGKPMTTTNKYFILE
jgi:hypothetical protein